MGFFLINGLPAWLLYRDRVLLQISQNMELLREERSLQVATLASALRPWLTLDSMKNNQLAVKLLSWEEQRLETVGQFAEVLLERKNRVWARVFIHVLSSCGDVNAALSSWARCLNDAGQRFSIVSWVCSCLRGRDERMAITLNPFFRSKGC